MTDDLELPADFDAASTALKLILSVRQLLLTGQACKIEKNQSEKSTQTDSSFHSCYSKYDIRSAVYNERIKGKLKAQIEVLKERCRLLEKTHS